MAITSVQAQLNNITANLTYNEETGYYEGDIVAPNIPSALTEEKFYSLELISTLSSGTYTLDASNDTRLMIVVIPNFIYDRTDEDVDLVAILNEKYQKGTITNDEKAVWNTDLKGALNLSDLKRNEFNLYCVSEQLSLGLTTKYNASNDTYSIPEIPRTTYYKDLLDNVQEVYDTGRHYTSTPEVPAQPLNTYVKWNAIEQILHDAFYVAQSENDGLSYSGELYSGQLIGLI